MNRVRRGRAPASPASGRPSAPAPEAPTPAAPAGATPSLPAALLARQEQTVRAALDRTQLRVTRLVRSVSERLSTRPSEVRLATLEVEVRDLLLALGRELLEDLVRLRGTGSRGPAYVCACGTRLTYKELAPLQQRTWFGPITLERATYAGTDCPVRGHHVPLDAAWAVLGADAIEPAPPATRALPDPDGSPAALVAVAPGPGPARLAPAFATSVVDLGTRLPCAEAAAVLEGLLGPQVHLSPQTVATYTQAAGQARAQQEDALRVRTTPPTRAERRAVFDTAFPEPPAAAPHTLVISMDGAIERTRAGWKEVKLGAVYDLVTRTRQGKVVHEVGAPTYTATLDPATDFGRQVLAVAQRRGLNWASQTVVLGDGAKWIWKLAARRFPGATQIVDWFHAQEHLHEVAQLLYGEDTVAAWTWRETLAGELWAARTVEDVAALATAADEAWATPRKDLPDGAPRRTKARTRALQQALAYFTTNATRLRYGAFRTQHLPVGSGVVEGGCKSVLHTRLKRPGAAWSVAGAEAMVRLRALVRSAPIAACPHPCDRLAS